jgi:uncharacterized protein (TIGR00369 family)
MQQSVSPARVPNGFVRAFDAVAFAGVNGPLFLAKDPVRVGFHVTRRHLDATGHCHAGMLAFAADLLLIVVGREHNPALGFTTTISLTGDCLAPAKAGDWVEGTGEVVHVDGRTYVAQGLFRVGDTPVYRTNGVFRG